MLLRFCCIALSSTVLLAQNFSPAHFGNAEGGTQNAYPFGATVPFRYSQIHDDVPLMVITGMSFRHDYSTNAYPGYSLTMDTWMSTATTASAGMSTTFDNNHGLDKTQVIINRTYTLPPSNPSELPGQFVLDYAFDVPFVHLGPPGSLCWEVQITARTNTSTWIFHDSVAGFSSSSTANPAMAVGRFGTGCRQACSARWPSRPRSRSAGLRGRRR